MSTATGMSEKTITTVIDHQFATLIENMSSCNTLELSGFGKYIFHKKKAPNMMIHYLNEKQELLDKLSSLEGHARKRAEIRLSQLELSIKVLNQKLQSYENQFCTNLGGMEKSADSSPRDEGTDQSSCS